MKLIITGLFVLLFLLGGVHAEAQDISLGTAIPVIVSDKNVQDGDLISTKEKGYVLAKTPYDPLLFGVVTLEPAIYLYDKLSEDEVPVIMNGKAYVRVTSENGQIKRGDAITS